MRILTILFSIFMIPILFYGHAIHNNTKTAIPAKESAISLVVLGTIQDAGSPHIACKKACCKDLFLNPDNNRKVVSIGIIDRENDFTALFEATPDITSQIKILKNYSRDSIKELPDAVFLTHAHIGHYTGLMYFGKEATNTKNIPVYAMPRMKSFLENNGPWSQLVSLNNIAISPLSNNETVRLTSNIKVTPLLVPHRDEYSETVGFIIEGPSKKVLFIPDIDKCEKWDRNIVEELTKVDYAFIDATFYDGEEINNRDISQIPHPFIIESMSKFSALPASEKNKVYFIHMNHTNPALLNDSKQAMHIRNSGFHIAQFKDSLVL